MNEEILHVMRVEIENSVNKVVPPAIEKYVNRGAASIESVASATDHTMNWTLPFATGEWAHVAVCLYPIEGRMIDIGINNVIIS